MKKILVLGGSGAGKSTLAKTLHKLLFIPILHLDNIFWEKDWIRRDDSLFIKDLNEFMKQESYILDGNHIVGDTLQLRIEEADTIFFLNFNRFICLYGAFKRYLKYKSVTRDSMADGCNEKLDFGFVKWILWDYPKRKRKIIIPIIKKEFKGNLYIFNTRRRLIDFLQELGAKKND